MADLSRRHGRLANRKAKRERKRDRLEDKVAALGRKQNDLMDNLAGLAGKMVDSLEELKTPAETEPPAFRRPTAAPHGERRNLLRFLHSAPPAARVFRPGFHRPFPRTRKKYLKIANYPLLFSEKFFILILYIE